MPSPAASPWGSSYRLVAAEKWKAKSAAMGAAATQTLVDYASPRPGMQVLDLACGTGEPGITVAQVVGPTGKVVGVDLSPELLEVATGRARTKGLSNFVTQHADAHQLPFPERTFDLATCRCGVMFFDDVVGALVELRRVLKPAAQACFLAWGPFEQPYWQTTMKIVLDYAGGALLEPGGADPFRFSTPGSLSQVLTAAGFREVEESTRTVPWTWPGTAEELLEYACSTAAPFRPMIERVPVPSWPALKAAAYAAIERFRVGNEVRFDATMVLASGRA